MGAELFDLSLERRAADRGIGFQIQSEVAETDPQRRGPAGIVVAQRQLVEPELIQRDLPGLRRDGLAGRRFGRLFPGWRCRRHQFLPIELAGRVHGRVHLALADLEQRNAQGLGREIEAGLIQTDGVELQQGVLVLVQADPAQRQAEVGHMHHRRLHPARPGIGFQAQVELANGGLQRRGAGLGGGKVQTDLVQAELVETDLPGRTRWRLGCSRRWRSRRRGLCRRRGLQVQPVQLARRRDGGADLSVADRHTRETHGTTRQIDAGLLQADIIQREQRGLVLIQPGLAQLQAESVNTHLRRAASAHRGLGAQVDAQLADGRMQGRRSVARRVVKSEIAQAELV